LFALTGLLGALTRTDQPQGSWQVDITSAMITADRPPLQRADPANRWLVVQAKVEVTGGSSQTGLASMVRLSGIDGLVAQEPGVVLLRDGTLINQLHPGLPEELAFAWEQAANAAPPTQLTVRVSGSSPITIAVTTP
jgi:hypothetical protein